MGASVARAAFALVAIGLLASCGASAVGGEHGATPALRDARPDVRGEPLALLPPDAALVVRVDALRARASPHWPAVRTLIEERAGDILRDARDVLGFDPLAQGDSLAFGLYLPPGLASLPDGHGWLLLYVRGAFDPAAVLAAARASSSGAEPLVEREVDGLRFRATGARGYYFPAPDVLVFFDPALAGRLARRLSGAEARSEIDDPRFTDLLSQLPGGNMSVRLMADVRGLRATGVLAGAPADPNTVDLAVAALDAPGEVHGGAIARSASDAGAARLAAALDELRRSYLSRWDVRLLGMSRLLNQGVTAVSDGPLVRVRVDAYSDEASRILAAARLVQ